MKKISRRTAVLVGIPLGLLLAGGIAFAIVVLTTTIGGATGYIDSTASAKVASVSGTKSTTDCPNVTVDGASAVSINPLVSRTLVEGKTAEVIPGSCSATIRIENTGQVPITSSKWTAEKLPTGWSITQPYSATITIAPGQTGTVQLTVSAGSAAAAGPITGRIESTT
ncbi:MULTISPECIES: NEW3 domain-containing protein [Pseudonocardia]|uniref:NPCBM-associated, NEW3 domain of alpha-galactosidase n=1 Tax=Pseudonocardia autotrophica TaxID=2074 RepID=A0A1Y2MJ64_PSEAH|nr:MULTISPECIES: NEW3 domain-containing protein [Pseudonocardia]OSY35212.1 NPCBM-associated, NEW3 domain of alpha-galactosidase [Pseudonocardia autotrophica]TDN73182.1 alpha-galactosidase-like protein [Pseudonocardia autotrophica]